MILGNLGYTEYFWEKQKRVLLSSYINLGLVICNVLVFLVELFAYDYMDSMFAMNSYYVANGQNLYTIVTSMFMHMDEAHILNNMLILLFVGANVEYDIGHIEYLVLYFLSGILANIGSVMNDIHDGTYTISLGASGAVFGVVGAVIVIVLFGRQNLRPGSTLVSRLGVMVMLSLYSSFKSPEVNNAAHLGGLICGVIITYLITIIFHKNYTMEEWV